MTDRDAHGASFGQPFFPSHARNRHVQTCTHGSANVAEVIRAYRHAEIRIFADGVSLYYFINNVANVDPLRGRKTQRSQASGKTTEMGLERKSTRGRPVALHVDAD